MEKTRSGNGKIRDTQEEKKKGTGEKPGTVASAAKKTGHANCHIFP